MPYTVQNADLRLYAFELVKNEETDAVTLNVTWRVPIPGGHLLVAAPIYVDNETPPAEVLTPDLVSTSDDQFDDAGVTLAGDPPADWITS